MKTRVSLKYFVNDYRLTLLDINSNETLLYAYTVSINKCGGSCSTIDDSYA